MALARKDQRLGYARDRIDALSPRLSRLTVSVPAETRVEGLTLFRNGLELLPPAWGTSTPTDPGSYVLEAKAPGRRHWTSSVVVPPEGGSVTVTVPVLARDANDLLPLTAASPVTAAAKAPPRASAPPPAATTAKPPPPRTVVATENRSTPADSSDQSQRITALSLGGLGVVGIGVGGVLALGARSKFDDSASLCNRSDVCTPEGTALRESAQSKAMVASVVTGVGAAAVVGGLVLWLTAPSNPAPKSAQASWSVVPVTNGWGLGAHRAF